MPVSVASRKGVSALAHEAMDHRVILTSLGRAVAVVDSAERVDEDLRLLRQAAHTVAESVADVVKLALEKQTPATSNGALLNLLLPKRTKHEYYPLMPEPSPCPRRTRSYAGKVAS